MKTSEHMSSTIQTLTVSSRELSKANDLLADPSITAQAQADASSGKQFWARRLQAAQMPLDALEVAYAANGYLQMAAERRTEIIAVEALMGITDPSHPAYGDMRHGNGTRESDASHFDRMYGRRALEAADLFPPRLEDILEANEPTSTVLAFPRYDLEAAMLDSELQPELSA